MDTAAAPELVPYESLVIYQLDDEQGGHHDLVGIVTRSDPDKDPIDLCVLAGREFPNANVQYGPNYLRNKVHGARHGPGTDSEKTHGYWVYANEI